MEEAEGFGGQLAELQRDVLFMVGDLARFAEAKWPDTHQQIWPEWISPGLLSRTAAVSRAYPTEAERQAEAPYTIYMKESSRPDRIARVQAHVDAGRTSDEARKANTEERAKDKRSRWLAVFDTHMYIHKHYFSGGGVETAMRVSGWAKRTIERLKLKGVTDALFCFEGQGSFRKELTKDWETGYKSTRSPKEPELAQQIQLTRKLLEDFGYCCTSQDTYEADDCMASAAAQFPGKTTIITGDKDLKQCLGSKCNMLPAVEWSEDEMSGEQVPDYKWYTAKDLYVDTRRKENKVPVDGTGLSPAEFIEMQIIWGDNTDDIKGAVGIGDVIASALIRAHGTADKAMQAAKEGTADLTDIKRQAMLDFEPFLDTTRKLVTLVKTLPIPANTTI